MCLSGLGGVLGVLECCGGGVWCVVCLSVVVVCLSVVALVLGVLEWSGWCDWCA